MVEFDHFKQEAGLHTFNLSVRDWIEKTDAIGLMVKKGRYGGTFAYKEIAEYQIRILSEAENISKQIGNGEQYTQS